LSKAFFTGYVMTEVSELFNITIAAAVASFAISVVIVLTKDWHGKHSLDTDLGGAQKFHTVPVPRIGGISILAGILVIAVLGAAGHPGFADETDDRAFLMLLLAGMPALLAGLLEDLTKRVSVRVRLTATLASPLLACWLLQAYLPRLDVWGVDTLLGLVPFAIIVTTFCVVGVANSINIIDGFHGVAGSAILFILAGVAMLSWEVGDIFVMKLALIGLGAILGFLLVNYPTGPLFMGDGGAYFIGFWAAEVAVLMIARNPEVTTWQVLAIYAYPVIEVIFSVYRKKVIRKMSPMVPDRLHLHMLFYRRIVCQHIPQAAGRPWIRNAAVACIISTWICSAMLIAVFACRSLAASIALVIAQVVLYMAVYTRLVRGRWRLDRAFIPGMRLRTGGESA
jgi:UDP-N-acetylmuramyl pentapeptide phosphotransferase/UDP-N-acetylglucosamine-1-phosphate transferase